MVRAGLRFQNAPGRVSIVLVSDRCFCFDVNRLNEKEFHIMNATCLCPHCGQKVEFEAENAGRSAQCPNCQQTVTLTGPAGEASPSVVAIAIPGSPVKEYLKKLRENSCYGALRTIINVSFGLCVMGCLLAGVSLIMTPPTLTGAEFFGAPIFVMSVLFLGIVLLIAFRQAAFVVIDIADALLHEGNKTFNPP